MRGALLIDDTARAIGKNPVASSALRGDKRAVDQQGRSA
jgi:hypothetical protein